MNDYLISLYIDNELDLSEKRQFADAIALDCTFHQETCRLLEQEQLLREKMVVAMPPVLTLPLPKRFALIWRTWKPAVTGFTVALILLAFISNMQPPSGPKTSVQAPHRFVIYLPDVQEAAVVGSFTDWSPLPMEQIGNSGYWSLDLNLPPGEHRYSYLVGENTLIADPTILSREFDDFGGENSIINIETMI